MKIPHDYIESILSNKIVINCVSRDKKKFLKEIGAKKRIFNKHAWDLNYQKNNKQELAGKLGKLRDSGFFFAGAAGGWPPAAVFDHLREEGYVSGKIIEIMWRAPGKEIKRER